MFSDFSWELSNIPVFRPKRPKPLPLGPHILIWLKKGSTPWGAAPGWKASWVTHDFGLCYSFGMIRTEKEMLFRYFLERFQNYSETLRILDVGGGHLEYKCIRKETNLKTTRFIYPVL